MEQTIKLQNFVLKDDDTDYLPGPDLIDAIEIAIALGKPLLVTGEPGTGKTKLAFWLAATLANQTAGSSEAFRPKPFTFETKSTSLAADLFYNYDAVSHFGNIQRNRIILTENQDHKDRIGTKLLPQENQPGENVTPRFIELRALGLAIAQTHGIGYKELKGIRNYLGPKNKGPLGNAPMSSVVLIDEIDKAPREFANDLLNEIENSWFEIKELNKKIERKKNQCRIVAILTSNDEKTLPNAFLRRCIFYHIKFPDADRLLDIAKLKLGVSPENKSYDEALIGAIAEFEALRTRVVNKKPSTVELLDWINILYHSKDEAGNNRLQNADGKVRDDVLSRRNTGILVKTIADIESIKK